MTAGLKRGGSKSEVSTLFYLVTLREEDHEQRLCCLFAYGSSHQFSKNRDFV